MSTSNWSSINSLTTKAGYVPAVEETTLTAQDNLASNYFGWSIAVDNTGSRVVVGQINGDGSVSNSGKAIVFLRSGSTWSREAILSSSNETAGGQFGVAVDIDSTGTRIIVGANYETSSGATQGGRAYIFSRSGSTWIQEKTLMASDSGIAYERYGNSVAIDDSGTRCVVGASQGDSAGQLNIGKVYIFVRSGASWGQEALLTPPGGNSSWWFGQDVDIDGTGTRIVASALNGPYPLSEGVGGAGCAFILIRSGTSWSFEATIGSDFPYTNNQFGYSVSINTAGDYVAVSEPESAPGGTVDAGQVHIFKRTVTTWSRQAALIANDKASGDLFGYGCSLNSNGDRVVIGAYNADVSGMTDCGKAYIFTRSGSAWTQSAILAMSSRQPSDKCQTTAISGDGSRAFYSSVYRDYITTDTGVVGVFV